MKAPNNKAHALLSPRHAQYRRNARMCALLAKDAATPDDRETLMRMRQSWLALADNEEWLTGGPNTATTAAPDHTTG